MQIEELLTDLIARCNTALEGTEQITFFAETIGSDKDKEFINGGRFVTKIFRNHLIEVEHELTSKKAK